MGGVAGYVRSWVVSVVVYAATLAATGFALAGAMAKGAGVGVTWTLLVVPPLVAVLVGVTSRRVVRRPIWRDGVVIAAPVVVIVVLLALFSGLRSPSGVPRSGLVVAGVLPAVVALLTGVLVAHLVARSWRPPTPTAPSGYVPTGGTPA